MRTEIAGVVEKSIAHQLGIKPGDFLHKINGKIIKDFLDYQYLSSDEEIKIEIIKSNGDLMVLDIEKDLGEDLGLEFLSPVFDGIRKCRNKCVFCFVDQMPQGLRSSLYCKDDDYRLSFLYGNYITLTNLKEEDIAKIIEYRLSPLYLSVHATNPTLRTMMMNNPGAGKIKEQIDQLVKEGIDFNVQIVLCPGLNDGKELDNTIEDLSKFFPSILSVAVVPVGLTKHRQGLYPLESFSRDKALQVVNQVEEWQKKFKRELGTRLVFLSDEFYLLAGLELPKTPEYEDFLQIENGVGLSRVFLDDFANKERTLPKSLTQKKTVTLISGALAAKFLPTIVERLNKIKNLTVNLETIKNSFLGSSVTVTGLLTGKDIINSLKNKDLGDQLLVPTIVLKEGEEIFLDELTIKDLEKALNVPIDVVEDNADSLVQKILEVQKDE